MKELLFYYSRRLIVSVGIRVAEPSIERHGKMLSPGDAWNMSGKHKPIFATAAFKFDYFCIDSPSPSLV